MCFFCKSIGQRAKVAEKDIECWKVIRIDNSPAYTWTHQCVTPYVRGELSPKVKLIKRISAYEGCSIISEGYHSIRAKEDCIISDVVWKSSGTTKKRDFKISRFIIPAGTRYYENYSEYVSETIMLVE